MDVNLLKNLLKDSSILVLEEFKKKYQGKIPCNVSINECVDLIIKNKFQYLVIDEHWYGDRRDNKFFYLIEKENKYEVFASERHGQYGLEIFDDFRMAVFSKLDLIFSELCYVAIDSKINS